MKINPPSVQKLASWPSLKRHLKLNEEWRNSFEESELQTLRRYVDSGKIVHTSLLTGQEEVVERPSRSVFLSGPLGMTSIAKVMHACELAPDGQAGEELALGALYQELSFLIDVLIETEFPTRFGRKLRKMSIAFAGWIGVAAAAGSVDLMERWAPLAIQAVRRGYIRDHDSRGMLHWILRLWCAARDIEYPELDYPRYEVAEGVLKIWKTPDIEMLSLWLEQMCNQHTVLSGSEEFSDFSNTFSHFPVDVLMLLRLRDQAGFINPVIDHPIMKFPWSRLWPIKTVEPDELLSGVYRRLEINEGFTVRGLYQQLLAE